MLPVAALLCSVGNPVTLLHSPGCFVSVQSLVDESADVTWSLGSTHTVEGSFESGCEFVESGVHAYRFLFQP